MKQLIMSLLLISTAAIASGQSKPNIIIIYVDDLGYGDLGVTGHPNIRTPNLDRMATEGARFTNYYSASPACTASRYALLTGKYPPRSGFRWVLNPDSPRGIHPKEHTLAEYLKEEGYRTAIFGKWHLGSTKKAYLPLSNGFDEFYGLPYSNDMLPPKYPDIALLHGYDTVALNPDQSNLTRKYTEHALKFIESNRNSPFFIYLPYAMPHTPLFPGEGFQGRSKRGKYGDVVEEIDYYIGRIMDFLKDEGLAESTILLFTSDNGPWLREGLHGGSAGLFRDGKGSTWEGGLRVPLFAWGYEGIKKRTVVDKTITALDILPSILGLIDRKSLVNAIDGLDMSPLFRNEGEGREVFYYYGLDHNLFAVRKGSWKLHVKTYSQLGIEYFSKEIPLLFNLDEDPSEQYNLASEHPDLVEELIEMIEIQKQKILQEGSFWE